MNEENNIITHNVNLLNWYFQRNKNITSDEEKQKLFSIMSLALVEDPMCFIRIFLYIANTRQRDEEEIAYKIMIHFLGIMIPECVMANIDLFINLGKKDDILYFLQCPSLSDRVFTYIRHKTKSDSDFIKLTQGELIKKPIKRRIYYRPKLFKQNTWSVFLNKILDDPTFNGITV